MLIFLFGLPAAGKNYVGRILADDYCFHFHDADDDLPPDMLRAIQNKQIATEAMRDAHLQNIIAQIRQLQGTYSDIAVAAALFKERHRREMVAAFPDALLIWVRAESELLTTRLRSRQNHLADEAYARKIFAEFEPPQPGSLIIDNNHGPDNIRQQIEQLPEYAAGVIKRNSHATLPTDG